MSMNSLNVEKAKKVLVPILISVGGIWTTYVGYYFFPLLFGYMRFHRSLPTKQMLDKAWEGFEYDPESNSIEQLAQILSKSSAMYQETMFDFNQLIKKQRLANVDDLKEYVPLVKEEIELKTMKARTYEMLLLTHKNHNYDLFHQKYFQESNDEQVLIFLGEHEIKYLKCHDQLKCKLPTINQIIEQLKKIIPMMKESKPQIERIYNMLQANGQEQYRYLYLQKYLEDVSQTKLNIQFFDLVASLSFTKLQFITQTNLRDEIKRLVAEYENAWKILLNN